MSSENLHAPRERLRPETITMHQAIVSLMEELEAVDWYGQRVEATTDADLRAILAHNRDEEIEHAAMVLEWLRRHTPKLDEELKTYLFTEGPVTAVEENATGDEASGTSSVTGGDGSLGIGSLKGETV